MTGDRRLLLTAALVVALGCVGATAQPAPDPQPVTQPTTQPESQPSTQPQTRPATQPATQPTTRPETQPGTHPESQPASQPTSQPTTSPATKPAAKGSATTTTATTTASAPATAGTTTTTSQPAEKKDRYLAVINGQVHTVTGPVLPRATVLSKNGIITAIGADVPLPPECEVVDAGGWRVYPGLVAAMSGSIFGPDEPQDTTNVYSLNMTVALAGGITTALTGNHVAKLTFGTTEQMLLKPSAYIHLGPTRQGPLERAQFRADLERVRTYLRDLQRHEREKARDPQAKPPDKEWLKDKYENYRKLLAHEAVAVLDAGSRQTLLDIAELAQTYDFHCVVRSAYEGWTVAPQLGRAGLAAVVTPREDRAPDERSNRPNGSSIENAHRLFEHGVIVAVVPATAAITFVGLAGRDLLQLNMEAAFAVRGGMTSDEALRTITIDAARVLGVDDRVGSLEVGKDADILVADGDLLHYMTLVHKTIVNGRVAYDKSKETLFAHIRPQGRPAVPEFDDQWPRRLEWK